MLVLPPTLACDARSCLMKLHMTIWSQSCCSVPDDTDALETEMVGVPELFVWWLAALLSDVVSLATLSAPSGCIQTHKHTLKNYKQIEHFASVLPGVCLCCWPWPSGCRCRRTVCPVFENAHCWGLWASPRTPTAPDHLCNPERQRKIAETLKNGESNPDGHQNNTKYNYSCLKPSDYL